MGRIEYQKMRNEMKKKISIECLNYNMEFKKDDNKNNFSYIYVEI